MRNRTLLLTALLAWGLLTGGCEILKEGTMLENERDLDEPPDGFGTEVGVSQVQVYDDTSAIGCRWRHVALIRLPRPASAPDDPAQNDSTQSNERIRRAKRRAAAAEANGIVLTFDPTDYGPYGSAIARQDRFLAIEEERPCP